MSVEQLEARLAQNPHSPLFARLAHEYLRTHRVDDALKLCLEGLKRFPDYITANYIAAQCYALRQDFGLALQHLQSVLNALPDHGALLALRKTWLEKSQLPRDRPPEKIGGERRTVDQMPSPVDVVPPYREASSEEHTLDESSIVSVTLAEIYEAQGAFEAAIAMYRRLQQQKPQKAEQFEAKIRELKGKIRQRT